MVASTYQLLSKQVVTTAIKNHHLHNSQLSLTGGYQFNR